MKSSPIKLRKQKLSSKASKDKAVRDLAFAKTPAEAGRACMIADTTSALLSSSTAAKRVVICAASISRHTVCDSAISTSSAELRLQWSQGSGEKFAALECAASCGTSCDERPSLVALGFRGESALFFAHVAEAADAIEVVRNQTARFALDACPLALSCAGSALHVLTSESVVMLDVGGAGGVVRTIASVDISALLQSAAPACADSADDDDDDDDEAP